MKSIKYIAALFLAATAAVGCSDKDNNEYDAPMALEAVTAELGASATMVRAANAADPTLTLPADRTGHLLNISIGSLSNKAAYKYDSGQSAWVPNVAGSPVYFPGFASSSVICSMANSSVAGNPVAAQRGTAQQLMDADVLAAIVANQTPVKNLTGVTLTHANALLDITMDSALDLSKVNSVKIGTDMTAYAVPVGSGDPENYLMIITPGSHKVTVAVDYNGIEYSCDIEAGTQASDIFVTNGRYKLTLSLIGGELVCGAVLLQPWADAGSGSGVVNP